MQSGITQSVDASIPENEISRNEVKEAIPGAVLFDNSSAFGYDLDGESLW